MAKRSNASIKSINANLLVFCASATINSVAFAGEVVVDITNFKNNKGQVVVSLFNDVDAFPTKPDRALQTIRSKIVNLSAVAIFANVSPGEYAISVFHDENDNNRLDTNFIGIPKEPVAVSSNAVGHFGPPKFSDAKFRVEKINQKVKIQFKD